MLPDYLKGDWGLDQKEKKSDTFLSALVLQPSQSVVSLSYFCHVHMSLSYFVMYTCLYHTALTFVMYTRFYHIAILSALYTQHISIIFQFPWPHDKKSSHINNRLWLTAQEFHQVCVHLINKIEAISKYRLF